MGYERNFKFKLITGRTSPGSKSRHLTKHHHSSRLVTGPSTIHGGYQPGIWSVPRPEMGITQTAMTCDGLVEPFLKLLFPPGSDPCTWRTFPGGWLCSLSTLFHNRGELVNQGLLALYTGFIGKKNGDARLSNISAELYVNALQSLRNSDIWLKQRPCPDEIDTVLAIILIFSRIELLTSGGGRGGYISHIRGGLQLIKRFSERLSNSFFSSTIFKTLRFIGVCPKKNWCHDPRPVR